MYVLPLHAGTIINFIAFSHFVIEVGLKAKGIKENLVINTHAVFPVTVIVSPDFLLSVMPSLLPGMTVGWILRFVTRQKMTTNNMAEMRYSFVPNILIICYSLT
jgi:hypothetical protein